MLLKRRPPAIDSQPITTVSQYAHLDRRAVALLRWLQANNVQFVLVGSVAHAIRGIGMPAQQESESGDDGDRTARCGPVSIVPAPFGRNFERLSKALWRAHARLRVEGGENETVPFKVNEEKLIRGQRWTLRCGDYDLDIEGRPERASRYQELLYEAGRFELAPDLAVQVASPEDLAHYAHLQLTGDAPEIRITRNSPQRNAV